MRLRIEAAVIAALVTLVYVAIAGDALAWVGGDTRTGILAHMHLMVAP